MNWVDVASNQCFSGNTLQNAVDNGYFVLKSAIPANGRMITKDGAQSYVYINPIPSKASNQLVVKSNLTAASLLPYSYTLYFDFGDGNFLVGFNTSTEACGATNSITVYSSSSTIAIGMALYYDAYGTERLVASTAGTGCSGNNYFKIGSNFITFEPIAPLQCDGYIIDSIGTCSIVYLTVSSGLYPVSGPSNSAIVNVTNNTGSVIYMHWKFNSAGVFSGSLGPGQNTYDSPPSSGQLIGSWSGYGSEIIQDLFFMYDSTTRTITITKNDGYGSGSYIRIGYSLTLSGTITWL